MSGEPFSAQVLRELVSRLKEQVVAFDASVVHGTDALVLLTLFSEAESACSAGKAAAARRVETSNAHLQAGFRDAASLIAARTGTSRADAVSSLVTARHLEQLPDVGAKYRSGEISSSQVVEIAKASSVDASAQARMLDLAINGSSLRDLSLEARRVLACQTQQQSFAQARQRRYFRVRQVDAYNVETYGRFTTEDWAKVNAVLLPLAKCLFHDARRAGHKDNYEAYAADAVVEMALRSTGDNKNNTGRVCTTINVVVDHAALVRGSCEAEERCEVPGVGPLPVSSVKAMQNDCYLRVLVTKGKDVLAMGTESRYIPAGIRASLNRTERVCSVRGCDIAIGLELVWCLPNKQRFRRPDDAARCVAQP